MKYTYSILIMFIISLIAFSGCSKLNEDIPTPAAVEIHGEGNINPESDNFHGYKVADSELEKKLVECQQCHGGDYTGGITPQACNDCHTGIQVHTGSQYEVPDHFTYFYANEKSLSDCWSCHGEDYSGGIASPSCLTCHTNPGGPEACNTCHGQFGDLSKIAPPDGLNNKEDQSQFVGAHTAHMYDTQLSYNLVCEECHVVPENYSDEGHIDDGNRAEIFFGQIRAEAASTPAYKPQQLSCDGTYCHGNFAYGTIVGNAFEPKWLEDNQANCGSCHGQDIDGTLSPLPTGHFGAFLKEQCYMCHPNVVDNTGAIIGPDLHINGAKDF